MDRLAARACTVSGLRFPWVVNISSPGPAAAATVLYASCALYTVPPSPTPPIHLSFVHRVRFFDLFSRSIWLVVVCRVFLSPSSAVTFKAHSIPRLVLKQKSSFHTFVFVFRCFCYRIDPRKNPYHIKRRSLLSRSVSVIIEFHSGNAGLSNVKSILFVCIRRV